MSATEEPPMAEGDDFEKQEVPASPFEEPSYVPEQCDDDYQAEQSSDGPEKTRIQDAYFQNSTVKKQEDDWYENFHCNSRNRQLRIMFIVMSIIFGLLSLLCRWAGSGPKALLNPYTINHMNFNCAFFDTYSGVLGLFAFYWVVFYMGKFRNTCLYIVTEFVMTLVRIAVLGAFCYYVIWKQTIPLFKHWALINSDNWWKQKTDPFLTNDSLINAFFCWFIWIIMLILITALTFSFVINCIITPLKRKRCPLRCRDLRDIFDEFQWSLRIYIWCLDKYQLRYGYPLSQKCPECKQGFSGEDKLAKFDCPHWHHRQCMIKQLDLNDRENDRKCKECGAKEAAAIAAEMGPVDNSRE